MNSKSMRVFSRKSIIVLQRDGQFRRDESDEVTYVVIGGGISTTIACRRGTNLKSNLRKKEKRGK